MPLPIADILRSGAPEGASEPMPGVQAPPPAPPAAPLSIEQGVSDMRRGAGMRQEAGDEALARQTRTDALRAAEMGQHREAFDPLQAQLATLTSQPLPPAERPPELPAPPDLQVRPFLQGTPGEPPEQSLHKAVLGLSVLAQMGFGAASGVPELSLRTLAGAMQGWQEGDILRGDREFGQWQATVSTLQKDYQNRRQLVEDIVTRNRGDVERTRIALLTELARHGASMQELQALTESDQAYFALLDRQGSVIQDLGTQEATLGVQVAARQMDAQMKMVQMQQWIADHQLKVEAGQRADVREGRIASAQERSNELMERALGVQGGTAGSGAYDTSINVSPRGTSVNMTPKKLGETAQKDLRSYDSILNTIGEIRRSFKPEEMKAYTGLLQRGLKDTQQFAGSVIPGLSDKQYAMFKTLTARLQSSAFEVGGKQLTPFEYSVIEKITPTGSELGGLTEYTAKMDGLEKFTRARKAATMHYAQRGLDPAAVSGSEWDQTMNAALQAEGMAPPPATTQPSAPADAREGTVSKSGKYIWKGGQWQPR